MLVFCRCVYCLPVHTNIFSALFVSTQLMIEVKELERVHDIATAITRLINQYHFHEHCFVAGFNPLVLAYVRYQDRDIETCMLYCKNFLHTISSQKLERLPVWV